jgi:hypothetical protein
VKEIQVFSFLLEMQLSFDFGFALGVTFCELFFDKKSWVRVLMPNV